MLHGALKHRLVEWNRCMCRKINTTVIVFLIFPHFPPFSLTCAAQFTIPTPNIPPYRGILGGSQQAFSIFPQISTKLSHFPPFPPIFPPLAHF